MPRFYFDSSDGDHFLRDETGVDLPSREAARREALKGLSEMAKDVVPRADRRELLISVRESDAGPFFRAELSLVAEWLD